MTSSAWRWFGVKTVFRTEAGAGAPSLAEERVVLIRARTADEAMRAAERDARAYAGEPFLNRAGQDARRRYLGACASYELFGGDAGRLRGARGRIEVFSATRLLAADATDDDVVALLLGEVEDEAGRELRWRAFVPREVAGEFERIR